MDENDLRPLRIIAAALIAGPALFLAVTIFVRSGADRMPVEAGTGEEHAIVTWTSLFVGLAVIGASLVLPKPQGADITRIRAHFIMRLAIVESGALLGGVAYMLEGEVFALGMAALCLAVMIALHFPTRDRVERLRAARS